MAFTTCLRDMAYMDQFQAFTYHFSFRIIVSVAEEQLKWFFITKQKIKEVMWGRRNGI